MSPELRLSLIFALSIGLILTTCYSQTFDPNVDDREYLDGIQKRLHREVMEAHIVLINQTKILQKVTKAFIESKIKENLFKAVRSRVEMELDMIARSNGSRYRQARQDDGEDEDDGSEVIEASTSPKPSPGLLPQLANVVTTLFGPNLNVTSYVREATQFLPADISYRIVSAASLIDPLRFTSTTTPPPLIVNGQVVSQEALPGLLQPGILQQPGTVVISPGVGGQPTVVISSEQQQQQQQQLQQPQINNNIVQNVVTQTNVAPRPVNVAPQVVSNGQQALIHGQYDQRGGGHTQYPNRQQSVSHAQPPIESQNFNQPLAIQQGGSQSQTQGISHNHQYATNHQGASNNEPIPEQGVRHTQSVQVPERVSHHSQSIPQPQRVSNSPSVPVPQQTSQNQRISHNQPIPTPPKVNNGLSISLPVPQQTTQNQPAPDQGVSHSQPVPSQEEHSQTSSAAQAKNKPAQPFVPRSGENYPTNPVIAGVQLPVPESGVIIIEPEVTGIPVSSSKANLASSGPLSWLPESAQYFPQTGYVGVPRKDTGSKAGVIIQGVPHAGTLQKHGSAGGKDFSTDDIGGVIAKNVSATLLSKNTEQQTTPGNATSDEEEEDNSLEVAIKENFPQNEEDSREFLNDEVEVEAAKEAKTQPPRLADEFPAIKYISRLFNRFRAGSEIPTTTEYTNVTRKSIDSLEEEEAMATSPATTTFKTIVQSGIYIYEGAREAYTLLQQVNKFLDRVTEKFDAAGYGESDLGIVPSVQ